MTGVKHLPEAGQDRSVPSGSPGRWTPAHPPSRPREHQTRQHCRSGCGEAWITRGIGEKWVRRQKSQWNTCNCIPIWTGQPCLSAGMRAFCQCVHPVVWQPHRRAQWSPQPLWWHLGESKCLGRGERPSSRERLGDKAWKSSMSSMVGGGEEESWCCRQREGGRGTQCCSEKCEEEETAEKRCCALTTTPPPSPLLRIAESRGAWMNGWIWDWGKGRVEERKESVVLTFVFHYLNHFN